MTVARRLAALALLAPAGYAKSPAPPTVSPTAPTLSVTSPDFTEGAPIPAADTCRGAGHRPARRPAPTTTASRCPPSALPPACPPAPRWPDALTGLRTDATAQGRLTGLVTHRG